MPKKKKITKKNLDDDIPPPENLIPEELPPPKKKKDVKKKIEVEEELPKIKKLYSTKTSKKKFPKKVEKKEASGKFYGISIIDAAVAVSLLGATAFLFMSK